MKQLMDQYKSQHLISMRQILRGGRETKNQTVPLREKTKSKTLLKIKQIKWLVFHRKLSVYIVLLLYILELNF